MIHLSLTVTVVLSILAINDTSVAEISQTSASDLIEKMGDDGLKDLKKMSYQELAKDDGNGKTPFYWSIFHGASKTRDFLVATLKKEDLIGGEQATDLFVDCANNSGCPEENLEFLHQLGFQLNGEALASAVTGTQECSIGKFKLLRKLKAPLDERDKRGLNLLHRIVERSIMGRPTFSRDCLVSAIALAVTEMPELKSQKNPEGRTPLQLATHYRRNKGAWGSGIQERDLTPIIKALQTSRSE